MLTRSNHIAKINTTVRHFSKQEKQHQNETKQIYPNGVHILFTLAWVKWTLLGFFYQSFLALSGAARNKEDLCRYSSEDRTRRVTRSRYGDIQDWWIELTSTNAHKLATTAHGGAATSASRKNSGPDKSCFAPEMVLVISRLTNLH